MLQHKARYIWQDDSKTQRLAKLFCQKKSKLSFQDHVAELHDSNSSIEAGMSYLGNGSNNVLRHVMNKIIKRL